MNYQEFLEELNFVYSCITERSVFVKVGISIYYRQKEVDLEIVYNLHEQDENKVKSYEKGYKYLYCTTQGEHERYWARQLNNKFIEIECQNLNNLTPDFLYNKLFTVCNLL